MSTDIYYFSGTGNSLYVAKGLQGRIEGARLIPIASLMDQEAHRITAPTVGFVFPTHKMISPIPVRKFLKKVDLGSAEYLFAIATRGGTKFLGFPKIDRILRKKGKSLDAYFTLNMAGNDPKFKVYDVPTEEKIPLELLPGAPRHPGHDVRRARRRKRLLLLRLEVQGVRYM